MSERVIHTDASMPYRRVLAASTLAKDDVYNRLNEKVGSIQEIMIDVPTGRVAYTVLSVGGFLGMGDRLFAIPWRALTLDEDRKCFVMDVDKRVSKMFQGSIRPIGPIWLIQRGIAIFKIIGRIITPLVLSRCRGDVVFRRN